MSLGTRLSRLSFLLAAIWLPALSAWAGEGVSYEGGSGPGHGRRIVFLAGDEEYRSEEGLPMLAKILAARHGFSCTVLFSINPAGDIDPDCQTNIPGMQALDTADLCVMQLRFRELPDEQMKHFVDYVNAGKPIIGAPGCARSPKENGFDWVLDRILADVPISSADIKAMGVGGLMMEIASRPQPRLGDD